MSPETELLLKKLSKGKAALSKDQLLKFKAELASLTDAEVSALFEKRKVATKATPAWLTDMKRAQKKIDWTTAEATEALLSEGRRFGLLLGMQPKSFSVAANRLAGLSSGQIVRDIFVDYVDRHAKANQRI